jgi:hypothetical protein
VPYAFVAVLAVRFFEFVIVHWFPLKLSISQIRGSRKGAKTQRTQREIEGRMTCF